MTASFPHPAMRLPEAELAAAAPHRMQDHRQFAFSGSEAPFGFFENPASLLDKLKSGDGGPGAAIGPLEENGSQPILEFSKTPTQSRLADIDGFRCLSQAPVLRRNNR